MALNEPTVPTLLSVYSRLGAEFEISPEPSPRNTLDGPNTKQGVFKAEETLTRSNLKRDPPRAARSAHGEDARAAEKASEGQRRARENTRRLRNRVLTVRRTRGSSGGRIPISRVLSKEWGHVNLSGSLGLSRLPFLSVQGPSAGLLGHDSRGSAWVPSLRRGPGTSSRQEEVTTGLTCLASRLSGQVLWKLSDCSHPLLCFEAQR